MPFRDIEHIREQIRRVEETTRGLLEEKAELERRLGAGDDGRAQRRRWRNRLVAVIVGSLMLGSCVGSLEAFAREDKARATQRREAADDLDRERVRQRECRQSEQKALSDYAYCEREKTLEQSRPFPRRAQPCTCDPHDPLCTCVGADLAPGREPCRCQPGDPLCSCSEVFDRAAAARSLANAQGLVESCIKPRRGVSFHAQVSFAPKGIPDVIDIDSTMSGTQLGDAERACIITALGRVKVPPFGGASVRVGKSYSVMGSAAP